MIPTDRCDASLPSLADRVRHVEAGAHGGRRAFPRRRAGVRAGRGGAAVRAGDGEQRVAVHKRRHPRQRRRRQRIVTGGDDGTVVATGADGDARASSPPTTSKRWIDQVALGPDGAVAWSAGKTAHVRTGKGEERALDAPSTVARPRVRAERLPARHRALQRRARSGSPTPAPRRRSSNGRARISASPSARTAASSSPRCRSRRCTAGASPTSKHMRMSGYSARVRSLSWCAGGDYLATSGSEQLILWPFDGKDGPMGRQPTLLARREARVTVVACHPRAAGGGDRLCRRRRALGARRGRRRDPGAAGRRRAGQRARLGHRWHDCSPMAPRPGAAGVLRL